MSASFSFEFNSCPKNSFFQEKVLTWWVHQRTSLQILWRKIFCKIDYFECLSKKNILRVCLVEGGAAPLLLAPLVMGSTRPKPKFLLNHIWYTTNIKKESWLRFSIFFFFQKKSEQCPENWRNRKFRKKKQPHH